MKKNIFRINCVAVLIIAVIVTLISCNKVQEQNIDNIITNFKSAITLSQNDIKGNEDIAFYQNPFNEAGVIHNNMLINIIDNGYLDKDSVYFLEGFNKYTGFNLQNLNALRYIINNYFTVVFDKDMNYNPDFVNNMDKISELEKRTVNTFFIAMCNYASSNEQIAACKRAEEFIINSQNFKKDEKERLLSMLAVYRYSTAYWAQKALGKSNGNIYDSCVYNTFDAIGEYVAREYSKELAECCGIEIQDGKDIHLYGGSVSMTAYLFSIVSPFWFIC
ncbi:MAG: hypothetical protein MJZ72_02325 [Bacteroidales bacterium]|nr:hypothetical protein [Bacteroidales bacterium]